MPDMRSDGTYAHASGRRFSSRLDGAHTAWISNQVSQASLTGVSLGLPFSDGELKRNAKNTLARLER
jgi:hypothetical protein